MLYPVIWFVDTKCVAGKAKPPEVIGLMLPHKTFAVFTYLCAAKIDAFGKVLFLAKAQELKP